MESLAFSDSDIIQHIEHENELLYQNEGQVKKNGWRAELSPEKRMNDCTTGKENFSPCLKKLYDYRRDLSLCSGPEVGAFSPSSSLLDLDRTNRVLEDVLIEPLGGNCSIVSHKFTFVGGIYLLRASWPQFEVLH